MSESVAEQLTREIDAMLRVVDGNPIAYKHARKALDALLARVRVMEAERAGPGMTIRCHICMTFLSAQSEEPNKRRWHWTLHNDGTERVICWGCDPAGVEQAEESHKQAVMHRERLEADAALAKHEERGLRTRLEAAERDAKLWEADSVRQGNWGADNAERYRSQLLTEQGRVDDYDISLTAEELEEEGTL